MPHDLLKPLLRPVRASALRHLAPWLEEPEPEPEPELISARYWRIYITDNAGGAYTSIDEVEMAGFSSGPNLCTGGTAIASSAYSANPASNAFNNTVGTNVTWATNTGQALPSWLGYDFGSAVAIREIRIAPVESGGLGNRRPRDFHFEYSHNNADWTDIGAAVIGETSWTEGIFNPYEIQ